MAAKGWSALAACPLLLAACGKAPVAATGEMRVEDTVWTATEVTGSLTPVEAVQPIELHRPQDIQVFGDTLLIVDTGNDRIVYTNDRLELLGTVGRQGAGPGEFSTPVAVRVTGGAITVAEMGNGRFSRLSPEGREIRTIPHGGVPLTFGVLANGDLIVPSRGPTDYVERLSPAGTTLLGARTDTLSGDRLTGALKGHEESLVAVTAGDTVHVLDQQTGDLIKFAPDGRRVMERRLPGALLDSMVERRRNIIRALGVTPGRGSVPLVKGLAAAADGRLLVLLASGRTAGFIVDPHTYVAQRIVVPAGSESPAMAATVGMVSAANLYVLAGGGLYIIRLDPGRDR